MALDPTQSGDRERELDDAVAAYAEAANAGQAPDPGEWLARHPHLAPELAEFLADRAHLERVAAPLRTAVPPAGAPGRSVGDYELLEEIGRGGMGIVYKARQRSLNRLVALKMILAGRPSSPTELQRFRAEAENAARLDHPHIVPVYEVGECAGQPYFSMKLIAGESLAHWIARRRPPIAEVGKALQAEYARLLATVAGAVHHAHQRGVLHRDLKPANILLQMDPSASGNPQAAIPLVTDFGLSKRVEEDSASTQSGAVAGTPSYMAPEQASGEKRLTTAVDVYGLGAILYELLTGRPPFKEATPLDTLLQLRTREPLRPSALNARLDRDLETVCLKCLEKDPERRYGSAEALVDDLERWLHGEPIRARSSGKGERLWRWCRRNPTLAAVGGLAAAALVAVTVLAVIVAAQQSETAQARRRETEQAEAALRDSKRQSAILALDHGLRLCEADVALGMLWLARSLEVAPDADAALQRVIRANLATWGLRLHRLRGYAEYGRPGYLALSGDGRVAVTAGRIGPAPSAEVRLWEAATGKPLGPPWEYKQALASLALSPDGRAVLLGRHNGTARLWEAATGKPLGPPLRHGTAAITCLAVSTDAKALLADGAGPEFRVWDALAGQPLGTPLRHRDEVRAAAFSRDGKRFLTLSDWQNALWWETATGKLVAGSPWPDFEVSVAAFSPDGKTVLTGGPGAAPFWEADTGKSAGPPLRYTGRAAALAFSPDAKRVLTASRHEHLERYAIQSWRVETRTALGPSLWQEGHLAALAYRPDGRTFLTAQAALSGKHWAVRLWEPAPGLTLGETPADSPLAEMRVPRAAVPVAFSPDGKVSATPLFAHAARIWDATTWKPLGPLLAHTNPVTALAFSADGNTLLSWSEDRTVWRWDAATGKPLERRRLGQDTEGGKAIFSPAGRTLLTRGLQSARLWDTATGQAIGRRLQPVGEVRHWFEETVEAFSPDGRLVLTAGPDRSARLWDAATGKPFGVVLKNPGPIHAAAFRADGKVVLTAGDDESGQRGEAQLWQAVTGQPLGPALTHRGSVTAAAFSPDGKTVLTGSRDGTARFWDAATGKPAYSPLAHRGIVAAATFSPDGKTALTITKDQTAQLWDVATGKALGPSLPCDCTSPGGVLTAAFRPDGKAVLTATRDRAYLWAVPAPAAGEVERLRLWVEVNTGLELDAGGGVVELDAAAWRRKRQRLERLGGAPDEPAADKPG
jgi:eukaryotic-like serine/threonine-protein kinase